jgi:transcriptional regulator with XRE-family HTH domain
MLTLENLGRLIQEKRGDRGIRAAAKEIGISHATLSRVERGHLPDLENYQKICNWLGIETTAIASGTTSAPANPEIPAVHFRKEPTVTPETAQALAQMILAAQAILARQEKRA